MVKNSFAADDKIILLFDGMCNLCNGTVLFVIKRDHRDKFVFAALQSGIGHQLLGEHSLPIDNFGSLILIEHGKYYQKSTAVLKIAKALGRGWQLLYAFIIIPKIVRDFIYSLVAQNRYKIFGKRKKCMIPTPELKAKFR